MSQDEWPDYDDMEPGDEMFENQDASLNDGGMHAENGASEPADLLGEYSLEQSIQGDIDEWDEFDIDEWDEFEDEPSLTDREMRRSLRKVPELAARAALIGGLRAQNSSALLADGGVAARRSARQEGLFAEGLSLDDLESDLTFDESEPNDVAFASAAIRETFDCMDRMAAAAAATNSTAEAERLIIMTVPLVLQLFPRAYRALWPVTPVLALGLSYVVRYLHSRQKRALIRLLPAMLHNTVLQLVRYASQGRPISGQLAAKVLAKQIGTSLNRRIRPYRLEPSARKPVRRKRSLNGHRHT